MLAAQLGFSADHAQKTSAMALIETWEDEDVDDDVVEDTGGGGSGGGGSGGGGRRRVVCDGVARNLVPLLTGFRSSSVLDREGRGGVVDEGTRGGRGEGNGEENKDDDDDDDAKSAAAAEVDPMQAKTWIAQEITRFIARRASPAIMADGADDDEEEEEGFQ